jgi:hypothetical protein
LELLCALTNLVVACAVAYVALQQWQVARHRLRVDLFDRRYKVYDATRKFLSIILREARFEDAQLFEFYAGTSDAEFLFDSALVAYLEQVRKRAVHMRTAQRVYEHMPVGDERSRHVQAEHDDLLWLTDQLTAMTHVFSPYLRFSHVK